MLGVKRLVHVASNAYCERALINNTATARSSPGYAGFQRASPLVQGSQTGQAPIQI